MDNLIMNWLVSGDNEFCGSSDDNSYYYFTRIAYDQNLSFLYYMKIRLKKPHFRNNSFKYAGIYNKLNNKVYDVDNTELNKLYGTYCMGASTVQEQALTDAVRNRVNEIIGNDRNKLDIKEISSPIKKNDLQDDYRFMEFAREAYFKNVPPVKHTFECSYLPQWTTEVFLQYITDASFTIEKEAIQYIETNQETILYRFLVNDAIYNAYQELIKDQNNPIHLVKKIRSAMNSTTAKMVNVTILKNGQEFTFKTGSAPLRRDCTFSYYTYDLIAPDRKKYEELFGKNERFLPQEIRQITYNRNVIYQAD